MTQAVLYFYMKEIISLFQYISSYRLDEDKRQSQDNPIYGNIFVDGGGELSLLSPSAFNLYLYKLI